jgi:hypothetical protein
MKTKILILLCFITLWGCKKEKTIELYSVFVSTEPNAEVSVFSNESDFWSNKNKITVGFANELGKYFITSKSSQPDYNTYWIKVKKDSLNNYRNGDSYNKGVYKMMEDYIIPNNSENPVINSRIYAAFLLTTPTKLQLRVYNNGVAVQNAKVYLYETDVKYENRDNYYFAYFIFQADDYDTRGINSTMNHYKLTDSNGICEINDLEPHQYWFRIEKDGKTNATTKITTDGSLPDDMNITTALDIGIK